MYAVNAATEHGKAGEIENASGAAVGCFTILKSLRPERVGKRFTVDANGKLTKDRPVASIWRGRATTIAATTANFVKALRKTTESPDTVLVLDSFRGAKPGNPAVIEVVTDEELGRLTDGADAVSPNQGYFETEDAFWSARLKDRMQPSGYLLFDADNAPGMPEAWRKLTLVERLKEMDRPGLLLGILKCRRIEYLGSSARVVKEVDKATPAATHALIEISNPELIDALRAHVRVTTVLMGLSFKSPRYSRDEPDKIIGYSDLTLFDLVVWVGGRLVFNPKPDVSAALGYRVLDANVQIANPDGGVLDNSWIKPPDVKTRKAFRDKTGVKLKIDKTSSGGFVFEERGQLQFMTEVEINGVVKPLADWLAHLFDIDGNKMRCETPYRASESEAAFIRIQDNGEIFIHDSGTETNHYAPRLPWTDDEILAAAAGDVAAFATLSAMVDARQRQQLRQAQGAFTTLTEEELDALGKGPRADTLDAVKQAATVLKAGDVAGAEAVLTRLVGLERRTPVDDDFVLSLIKTALGKPATLRSLHLLLKAVEDRFKRQRAANDADVDDGGPGDDGGDLDEDDEEGGPPYGFRVRDGWMCRRIKDGDEIGWRPICSALEVTAMLRDGASSKWGLVVHFDDPDGRTHDIPLPAEVYGDPIALASLLTAEGLRLADASPRTRADLSTMLIKWSHPDRRTVAATPGWTHDRKAFLLGDGRAIGDNNVVLAHGRLDIIAAKEPGARDDLIAWKASVANLCGGNPVLLTGVSTAFAAPLLEVLNVESGIVHCRGDSSQGKTTVLRTAASVWGSPAGASRTWRATTNGLEGIAAMHNSRLLVLDELHQVAAKEAGAAALMLCNEMGKIRADQRGDTRAVRQWKLMVLSSGECSLADRIAENDGARITAGQEVRCVDLKVDERGFGCFDDLHGEADGKAFVIRLAAASAGGYGTAGPAFVEFIMRTPDIATRAEVVMAKFEADADTAYKLAGANAQVTRALRRFAIIAAGGELATEAGITGWMAGEAAAGVLEMFSVWIGGRGGLMSALDRNAVANTRAFLIKHASRFQELEPDEAGGLTPAFRALDRQTHNLAGWKDPDGYWIAADTWMKEIHAGVDGRAAARVLRDAKLLVSDAQNEGSRLTRRGPRSIDRPRCYYVKKAVIGTEQGI
jgi:putative DNA primase/helicase